MQRNLLDLVYPIGRGFIDYTDNDYSNYLGFTWERELMGMFPLGADDITYKIGTTGGKKEQTLTIQHIPPHDHEIPYVPNSSGACKTDYNYGISQEAGTDSGKGNGNAGNMGTAKRGGGQPFSIMPPYKVVYHWKRVS